MKIEDFGPYTLSSGSHSGPEDGMCVMEMVSFLAGDEWSDMPACACPVISRFAQVGNDNMPAKARQKLQAYVPRLIGTRSPEHESERVKIAVFAAVHVFTPKALDAAGLSDHAKALRAVPYGDYTRAAAAASAAYAAASAADAAASAAYAAASAAYAAADVWEDWFATLDAMIEAGPHGEAYSKDHLIRARELKKVLA